MNAILYINGRKTRFWINFGWYRGDPFKLISLAFISEIVKGSWSIIDFQILKLHFDIGLDLDNE
jgi:hypothetical protein